MHMIHSAVRGDEKVQRLENIRAIVKTEVKLNSRVK